MVFLLSDMKTGLILLLLSGAVLVSCSFTRKFHVVKKKASWFTAQRYCREHFTDLATIQDPDQFANAAVVAGSKSVWIGMFHEWQWSVEYEGVRPLKGFTNWKTGERWLNRYTVINVDGKWITKGWNHDLPSICYRAKTDSHFLVKKKLNWKDARSHCRSKLAELSRIRDQQENMIVTEVLTNQSTSSGYSEAWIGLSVSNWKWSDGGSITYTRWRTTQIEGHTKCGIMNGNQNGDWNKRLCREKWQFLCYTDVPHVDVRSLKIQLNPGSADLNDPAVQDSILQQLKQKLDQQDLRGVKLRWKIQPDGKVFHKKETACPRGDCEGLI